MPAAIPPPTEADHEDVHWALTTAVSLHARGDVSEALRWLRRAQAAAARQNDDTRAAELERSATAIEASLTGALTQRARVAERQREADALDPDQPTYVDSVPLGERLTQLSAEGGHVGAHSGADGGVPSTDSEITLSPFTVKAGHSPPSEADDATLHDTAPNPIHRPDNADRHRGARAAVSAPISTTNISRLPGAMMRHDADNAPTSVDGAGYDDLVDERTLAMRAPPNHHEIRDVDSIANSAYHPGDDPDSAHDPMSETAHAMAPVPRHRVALLASADGHDPRVMLLGDDSRPPPGAAVAYLIPASGRDAGVVQNLLDRGSSPANRKKK